MDRPTRPQNLSPKPLKFVFDGQTISYSVKRSTRARRVRLVVTGETGLTVVIPAGYNVDHLPTILTEKSRWILKNLARYAKTPRIDSIKELKSGSVIPFLGRPLKLVKLHLSTTADSIKLEGNRLFINLYHHQLKLNPIVEWWYRQQAEKMIREKVSEQCPRLGVSYGRICIKGTKTRWGSCSQKGNLNFNWKLMMVPEPVIEYVVIHELCHLKEMNHSKRFWQLVGEYCPLWQKQRKWLKDHDADLSAKFDI